MRAGWCRSWQTGEWWIVSYFSPGCGYTADSLGQSRVINLLPKKNGNWGLRRESSALTFETKLFLLSPHHQLLSPCSAMCPGTSQVTPVLHFAGKAGWILLFLGFARSARAALFQAQCVAPWPPRVVPVCSAWRQDPVRGALYCGPCELGSRVKAKAGPPVPPPQAEVLLGTGVEAVPMHSWFSASCGDVPSIPPCLQL